MNRLDHLLHCPSCRVLSTRAALARRRVRREREERADVAHIAWAAALRTEVSASPRD